MKKVIFYATEEIYNELKKIAQNESNSISAVVRELINEAIMYRQQKHLEPLLLKIADNIKQHQKRGFDRIAKLAVKAALYSVASRGEINAMLYELLEDKEQAEAYISEAWKHAVTNVRKIEDIEELLRNGHED